MRLPIAIQTNPGRAITRPPAICARYGCLHGLPTDSRCWRTYEGGNVDLRVPYIGYSSESESYTAAGISAYNALQAHVEKRLSHGVQVGFSYTYSHATDEQSAMGLFYNGNNPLNLRCGYGLSDFDRTHVINFTYLYEVPKFFRRLVVERQVGRMAGRSRVLPSSKAASPTASSTTRARWAAFSTAPPTASPTRSFRWRPAARLRRSDAATQRRNRMVLPGAQCDLLHSAAAESGRSGRRDSARRHLRNQLHHRPAQHLPATLAEARGHLARQDHEVHRTILPEVHASTSST